MLSRRIIHNLTYSALLNKPSPAICSSCINCRHAITTRYHESQRASSSASSQRWKSRQERDRFSREARVQGLKSRAAFKLLEINERYKILKRGQTVVDLVAVDRTAPDGRVIGIDVIPAQPPKGASTIQGNFLSPSVQAEVKRFLRDPNRGRVRQQRFFRGEEDAAAAAAEASLSEEEVEESERGYIDLERHASLDENGSSSTTTTSAAGAAGAAAQAGGVSSSSARANKKKDEEAATAAGGQRNVDVVLSDMSAPWEQTTGFWKRSLSEPYSRMMNTSGLAFRDHAGSMDLCAAALRFCFDTLRTGGHFVCKFYQGSEDKAFELRLKKLFKTVHREKPESSRSASREAYFVALKRKKDASEQDVFGGEGEA
ncbi:MAG: 2' O-ribose methyltransferase [Peltula sp. TS41687]|nr:MAG: 2' O-ribose methyltransferase [Peltula sp. TS41687]